MRVIEREREHYEVQEVPYGKVYSWRPERIVLECDCGARLVWTEPVTLCGECGAVHTDVSLPSEDRHPEKEAYRPWLEEYLEWRRKKDASNLQHEYFIFERVNGDA